LASLSIWMSWLRGFAISRRQEGRATSSVSYNGVTLDLARLTATLVRGANSIFVGDTLLTAGNPGEDHDAALFRRLGIKAMELGVV